MNSQQLQDDDHEVDDTIPGIGTVIDWHRSHNYSALQLEMLKAVRPLRNKGDKVCWLENEGESRVVGKENQSRAAA